MEPEPDVIVSFPYKVSEDLAADFLDEARSAGLSLKTESRELEVFGVLEWIAPVVVLLVGHKFLGTLAQKAAEDAYPPLKAAFLGLIARTSGPDREIEPKIMSSRGKAIPSGPVSAFSVIYRSENGLWSRFIFPAQIPEVEQRVALETLIPLAGKLDAQENPDAKPRGTELIFDTQTRRWVEVDTMAEARRLHAQQEERRQNDQS